MKPTLLVASLMLSTAFLATSQKTPESMLGAALHQEEVQGDLKGAIAAYQKVLRAPGVSRKTAAQALVRMGQCYEKLGDAESRTAYERVLRDYADQKDAVSIARVRLGGNVVAPNGGIVARQVWSGPTANGDGSVSPDGRYLSFTDWDTGNLALHDLSSGNDRRLTSKGTWVDSSEYAERSVIAPDGNQVAYSWFRKDGGYDLRVADVSENGATTPRVLYHNQDIGWISPSDWSPDGKWIAVELARNDRTMQIGLLSATDGSLRVLKSVDWQGTNRMHFSPDGRYLAFDLPAGQDSRQRDVFVLAVDGSREVPAVVHPANDIEMGWMPDGRHLLFQSDRTGSVGLWALPFRDGKPEGTPKLIRSDIGRGASVGMTRSGKLYYSQRTGGPDVYAASIDFESGRVVTPPVPAVHEFVGSNSGPDWSPDGKYLSYSSSRQNSPRNQNSILVIRSVESGQTRELHPKLHRFNDARWAPDGRAFVAFGNDLKGRQGVYRIDAQTGEAGLIAPDGISPRWAPDGKRITFLRRSGQGDVIIDWDLDSGHERALLPEREVRGKRIIQQPALSPDGRYLAYGAQDPAARRWAMMLLPMGGGEPRQLLHREELDVSNGNLFTEWTPDSRNIVFRKGKEIWVLPLAGGEPHKIDLRGAQRLKVHPDGKRVVFVRPGANTDEIWVMEKLLPALSASR